MMRETARAAGFAFDQEKHLLMEPTAAALAYTAPIHATRCTCSPTTSAAAPSTSRSWSAAVAWSRLLTDEEIDDGVGAPASGSVRAKAATGNPCRGGGDT